MRVGGHRSPFHGFSAEFDQHRPYRAGDDLKYLDWKLLARTDRLYTRQFRETTNVAVMLVLDASASMAFPEEGVSKFRYAQVLTAALAYLIVEQGDAAGLMAMSDGALTYVPARGGRPHLRSLLAQIDRLEPRGRWYPARAIGRSADLLRRRGVVVVLSDFYDDEEESRRAMRRVGRRGHDVAMLQVISGEELAFPYRGDVEFTDLELGDRRIVSAAAVEREYREGLNAFLGRSRRLAHRDNADYALMRTDDPPDTALRKYLLERAARHRAGGAATRFA
jgi:uncharacterized protein (DUF58 family)